MWPKCLYNKNKTFPCKVLNYPTILFSIFWDKTDRLFLQLVKLHGVKKLQEYVKYKMVYERKRTDKGDRW